MPFDVLPGSSMHTANDMMYMIQNTVVVVVVVVVVVYIVVMFSVLCPGCLKIPFSYYYCSSVVLCVLLLTCLLLACMLAWLPL